MILVMGIPWIPWDWENHVELLSSVILFLRTFQYIYFFLFYCHFSINTKTKSTFALILHGLFFFLMSLNSRLLLNHSMYADAQPLKVNSI